jgi:hypothetical protein
MIHPTSYRDVRKPPFWCRQWHRWQRPINGKVICLDCLRRFPVDIEVVPEDAPMSKTTEREIEALCREIRQRELLR